MTRAVAARPALGRRQRARDRRDLGAARGDDREPLVRRAARPRHRRPHRLDRDRAARSSCRCSRALVSQLRLALRRGHGRDRRARGRAAARRALHARPARPTSALRRTAPTEPEPPPAPARNPFARRRRRRSREARHEPAFWLLAGSFFICGAVDERPDRDAPDPGRDGSRLRRGRGREPARDDRRLRHRRHDVLGLADRPLRSARCCSSGTTACAG